MHGANAITIGQLARTDKRRRLMLALFPDPHVLGIVATAAALIDGQFAMGA